MRQESFHTNFSPHLHLDEAAETAVLVHEPIKVILLDNHDARRTEVSFWLSRSGCVVQPFDGVVDLSRYLPLEGLLLIADEVGLIASAIELLKSRGRIQPFIAYAAQLSASRMMEALRIGAVDYVFWPDGKVSVLEAISAEVQRRRAIVHAQGSNGAMGEYHSSVTEREYEILRCFGKTVSPDSVERQLGIGYVEARTQALTIMHRLNSPDFSRALEVASSRRSWEREIYEEMRKRDALVRVDRLSPREREVLSQIARGSSAKEAALKLGISNRTVDAHRSSIFAKIEVRNVAEATQVAVFGGLV